MKKPHLYFVVRSVEFVRWFPDTDIVLAVSMATWKRPRRSFSGPIGYSYVIATWVSNVWSNRINARLKPVCQTLEEIWRFKKMHNYTLVLKKVTISLYKTYYFLEIIWYMYLFLFKYCLYFQCIQVYYKKSRSGL